MKKEQATYQFLIGYISNDKRYKAYKGRYWYQFLIGYISNLIRGTWQYSGTSYQFLIGYISNCVIHKLIFNIFKVSIPYRIYF